MKFEEVLPALREGKKIKRKNRNRIHYIQIAKEDFIIDENNECFPFILEDFLADNWEIVKSGPKKIKLRNLTLEEWEKRKEKYCADMSCSKCIFDIVNCSERGWIIHKDLHSDKFLDQEIEVEEND